MAAARDCLELQSAIMLDRSSALSPVSGWPDGFAAWAWEAWAILRAARDDRQIHAIKG